MSPSQIQKLSLLQKRKMLDMLLVVLFRAIIDVDYAQTERATPLFRFFYKSISLT